jgi:hypothetical protein
MNNTIKQFLTIMIIGVYVNNKNRRKKLKEMEKEQTTFPAPETKPEDIYQDPAAIVSTITTHSVT